MEDVIRHIKKLMSDVDKDHINIKAFIFDSAGEYAAAQYFLSAKFNNGRTNVMRNNGISSIPANKKSIDKSDPYNMDSFNQFHGNLVDFWDSTIGINPELAHVAISIPIYPDNENKDDNLNEGKYIQNWEIGKIKFKNNEDECFLSPEWNNDFDFTGQNVHPADDKRAKWSLSTLSESSLESPSFLGSDEYSLMHIKSVA
ncbi:hypothetical protein GLOIN_2v1469334 [Rhizophagus irregularis DAOM 181602=DAOM 197198]|nr:hypothetical protein GLOIN_2v1469334 [Rhizophagus irregularis DAOM 181602=DAOM 197198]